MMRRDNGLCQACLERGLVTAAEHVDHIVPLSAGGADTDENKRCLCASCHKAKSRAEQRGGMKSLASPCRTPAVPRTFPCRWILN